jgi:hypothetical protein
MTQIRLEPRVAVLVVATSLAPVLALPAVLALAAVLR